MIACAPLVGCGDDVPTRPGWVRKADAVCASAHARLAALPQPQSLPATATYAASAAALLRAEVAAIVALPADPADAAALRQLRGALARQVAVADGLAQVARAGTAAEVEAYVRQNGGAGAAADSLARALGLHVCGQASKGARP